MKKALPVIFSFIIFSFVSNSQVMPTIEWKSALGGSTIDNAQCVKSTSDGGYIVAGRSNSVNSDLSGSGAHGLYDYWVVKLNSSGAKQWSKALGGTSVEEAYSVDTTADGGYIVAGASSSLGVNGDVSGNHGGYDYWIVKLNSSGSIDWQKSFGGGGSDIARCIRQTSDGGYIVAGESNSTNFDVTGNHGGIDCWIIKINNSGNILWKKSLGGLLNDYAYSIQQIADGGYIFAGHSLSIDGNVTGNHGGGDSWVVKLDSDGAIVWEKAMGGSLTDYFQAIEQTFDGGYILAGYTNSTDGDVSANLGNNDYWIVKLDTAGAIAWEKTYGGTGYDEAYSIQQTLDSGFVIAGRSNSIGGDIPSNHGNYDYGVLKIDHAGNIIWAMSLGGTGNDYGKFVQTTYGEGYIVVGYSNSTDGDVGLGNQRQEDYWVVKLSKEVGIVEKNNSLSDLHVSPNPASQSANISFSLKKSEPVTVKVYDITGREVRSLLNKELTPGFYNVTWSVTDGSGKIVDNGLYMITVETAGGSVTERIAVIK